MTSINQNQELTVVQRWLVKLVEANKAWDKEIKDLMKKRAESKPRTRKPKVKAKPEPPVVEKPKVVEKKLPKNAGFVYFLQSANGYYKIGMTTNMSRRLGGVKAQFPIQIALVHHIASNDYRNVERFLHKKFARKRAQNEWFKLEPEDVRWFRLLRDYDLDPFC